MDVTSEEIRSSRFQGTRHVYDRREVDAFLHRAAATLEMYERKLAVTQSHLESLEKALDLANGRVRSGRARDARIGELEAALAAAQHNYELEVERAETAAIRSLSPDGTNGGVVQADHDRAAQILDEARRQAEEMRSNAVEYSEQAATEAAELTAAAQAAAEALLADAKRQEAAMLKDLAAARSQAERTLQAEIESTQVLLGEEVASKGERLASMDAVAEAEMAAKLHKAETRASEIASRSQEIIQQAEERAQAAETERNELAAELERAAEEAEANRGQLLADVELMVGEAVSQAEVDRDLMLLEAQVRLETAEGEREALLQLAKTESAEMTSAAEEQLESLRRQAAQMRTALSDLHTRFADVGSLSAEDFEVATALVDLDLHDVSALVDLTNEPTEESMEAVDQSVPVKSKWTQRGHMAPRGGSLGVDAEEPAVEEAPGAGGNGDAHPTWRDKVASASETSTEPAEDATPSLGFYERRLAGLRARLQDALPDDY